MQKFKKYLPLLIILASSIAAWSLGIGQYLNVEVIKTHHHTIQLFIDDNLLVALLIYCGIYISVVCLSIPCMPFMVVAGGILFGQWIGTSFAIIAATLGASIVFVSIKMATTGMISHKHAEWISKMQKGFQKNAFLYLLTLRFIPIVPFFAVNIAAAFFQIPFRTFFFGTFLGIIPVYFVYASIGMGLQELILISI